MAPARLLAAAAVASCCTRLLEALTVAPAPPVDDGAGSPESGAAKTVDVVNKTTDGDPHARRRTYTGPALRECVPCWTHSTKRPRLFLNEEAMGVGTRLHGFINGMAVAAKYDMNLGGVVSIHISGEVHGRPHGIEVLSLVTSFLGLKKPEELFTEGPPAYDVVFEGVEDMKKQFENGLVLPKGAKALLNPGKAVVLANMVRETEGADYYTPAFLEALRWSRAPIQTQPLFRKPGRPLVAFHLRRGDMSLKCGNCNSRTTTDELNLWILSQLKTLLPDGDVHIFSSLEGRHKPEEFDMYRETGATVHLDDLDVLNPLAHFARADVAILAKSSFSYAPAYVNKNCVIYQATYLAHLPGWIRMTASRKKKANGTKVNSWHMDMETLKTCIDRVAPAARAMK